VRDLEGAVDHIQAANPTAPLFCIAHSASAFLLVQRAAASPGGVLPARAEACPRYLAAKGAKTPIVAAVTLAGCMDFLRTNEFVTRTKNAPYRKVFARGLRRCVLRHWKHDPSVRGSERERREHAKKVLRFARFGPDVLGRCGRTPRRASQGRLGVI